MLMTDVARMMSMSAAEATRARVCPSSTPISHQGALTSLPTVQVMARKAAEAEAKLKKEEAAAAAEMAEAAKTKFTKSKRKSTTPRRSFAEASAVATSTHAGKSDPEKADDTLDWKARAEELEASIPGLQKEKDAMEARMRDMEAQLQDLGALMRETKAKLDAVENENKQLRVEAEATNHPPPGPPPPPPPCTEQPQPEPKPQQQPDPVTRDPARAALETHLIGINLQGLRKLMIFIQSLIPEERFRNRVKDAVWKDGICVEEVDRFHLLEGSQYSQYMSIKRLYM